MTDQLGPRDDAETPLSPEEREGIIPSYITLRSELNAAEQANILEAETWAFRRRRDVLDEIAARFHHKLVWIHCYPNGNGRHGRLATDLLLASMNRPRFTWGSANLVDVSETRLRYVAALRAADGHDIRPLLEFVRS